MSSLTGVLRWVGAAGMICIMAVGCGPSSQNQSDAANSVPLFVNPDQVPSGAANAMPPGAPAPPPALVPGAPPPVAPLAPASGAPPAIVHGSHYNGGVESAQNGRIDAAIDEFRKAIVEDPRD